MTVGTQSDVESCGIEVVEGAVRIPETQLKAVGYVCAVTHSQGEDVYGDPYATGFFVSVPCQLPEFSDMEMYYFVTARHVADDLKDRDVFFLVNKKGGGTTRAIRSVVQSWFLHPTDNHADVAVAQVRLNPSIVDMSPVSISSFGMSKRLKELNIGIGDEVHSIGLFSAVPGNETNTPIVRFGNISMMANEQIQTELGFTEMYLIEARSIGGMSGSPVFVRPTFQHRLPRGDDSSVLCFVAGKGDTLLGMAQGHWSIREAEINKPSFTHDSKRGVNCGIALVVPALKIYETIYQTELVVMRKMQEEIIAGKRRTVPGSDSVKEESQQKPFTQTDFEAALKTVTRKKSDQK